MYEYKIVVIGIESPPSLEAKLNKLGQQDWVVKCQIEFKHEAALLLERYAIKPDVPRPSPKSFQEAIVMLSEKIG